MKISDVDSARRQSPDTPVVCVVKGGSKRKILKLAFKFYHSWSNVCTNCCMNVHIIVIANGDTMVFFFYPKVYAILGAFFTSEQQNKSLIYLELSLFSDLFRTVVEKWRLQRLTLPTTPVCVSGLIKRKIMIPYLLWSFIFATIDQ